MTQNDQAARKQRNLSMIGIGDFGWILFGTIVLFLMSAVVAPGSVTKGAIFAMLPFAGMLAIVAVGQTLVIQQRGLDMSAAGVIALGGIEVSMLANQGMPLSLAILVTLLTGMLIGFLNGLLISKLSITPLVATLATGAVLVGAIRQISGGTPIAAPTDLKVFSIQRLFGLPYSLILAMFFIVVVAIITRRSIYGRRFVAVGVNPEAAETSGIAATKYHIAAYTTAGLSFTVAGMLFAGYIGNASHTAGADYLLPSIAAVVLGGTSFAGGRGSVIASGMAALFMTQLSQMVLSMGATTSTQLFVQAAAIVLATALRNVDWQMMKTILGK